MMHLPHLITDLALILTAAAVTSLIFKKLKQPLVLGYIIAGMLVSPHFTLFPTVTEIDSIEIWAEIGVIFLLFSLGLEFSFKKLLRVGGAASITAFVEIAFITITGYLVGKSMGWSAMDSMFLGGMLASSSTTIIIRAFDELGVKTRQFARVVFGVLVVEDIVVILLMVLLSTMAVSRQFEGMELLLTVGKLLFFLGIWFLSGIFILPTLLKKARKMMDEETLLILSVALCLCMVLFATKAGFSAELGAFIMGSILAETTSAEKIEHVIKPVKDLFGAVFFVSVGMLIDPEAILQYKWPVLIVSLLTIFGKLLSTTLGALISGQPLKQSIQVGMSMAQIGEFAFIVATLGMTLGVISPFLFPVAVGASAITTFTTPYMIKASDKLYEFIRRKLPDKWLYRLNRYASGAGTIKSESNWRKVLKSYAGIMLPNSIVLLALFLLSAYMLHPLASFYLPGGTLAGLVTLVVTLVVAAPFLMALMFKKLRSISHTELWLNEKYSKGPLMMMEIARVFVGLLMITVLAKQLLSATAAIVIAVVATVIVYSIFARKIQLFYRRIEHRFIGNLNARDDLAERKNNILSDGHALRSDLAPWSAHIVNIVVQPESFYVGNTLEELGWREQFGINVAYIKRGETILTMPTRNDRLYPFDQVGIIATDEQIQQFTPLLKPIPSSPTDGVNSIDEIEVYKLVVDESNKLKGLSIRQSGLREKTQGLVIGLERGAVRLFNPDSSTVFQWGDVVWLVGNKNNMHDVISKD
jgi:monovalent cation:H+ antiporter-2, CPA2 family